ncbi:MAG TPA: hypothetical protein VK095_10885 [Beutenbergiaceae bacterium]|nr:hypothetical protein [Beutenbergiaceae bacterium]
MPEGDETPYTTIEYLNRRYKVGLDPDDGQALELIAEASQKLRDEMPAAVNRALKQGRKSTLERITARMVHEALPRDEGAYNMPPGVETSQFGVGPFQESYRFPNPSGRLFITKEDRRALRGGQRAGSISVVPEDAGEPTPPWAAL